MMVKSRILARSALLLTIAALSCDRPVAPPTTGGIAIVLLSDTGTPMIVSDLPDNASVANLIGDGPANILLDGVRVTVSGPTNKSVTDNTPDGSVFNVVVPDLSPGAYTVVVEGLASGKVAHYGQTQNITVTAGQTAQAPVTFPKFVPELTTPGTSEDTVDVLRFPVAFSTVQNATSYLIEWSTAATMASPQSKSVTASPADVDVAAEGTYYYRVTAVNATVGTSGLPTAPRPVNVFQAVATVTVTPNTPTIVLGGTQQFSAEAKDALNATVPNVTWFWASSNHTVATVSQSGLVTSVAPGEATITAVGKGTPGSATLTVGPGAPAKLVFTVQPTTSVAGQPVAALKVAVQSNQNQTITSDNSTQIIVSLGNNPGGGSLSGTTTATVVQGVATFSDLSIEKAGAGYTLTAASSGLTGGTSSAFSITAGAMSQLAFSVQPTSTVAGDAVSPAIQVEIRDQFGNRVSTARDEVTIAIATNPSIGGAGVLTGTKKVNAIDGIASFTGIWINKTGTGYTFSASATGLTGATSTGFNISPAAPAKLAFSQQPTGTLGNRTILPAVTVTITDQFDNATTATNNVTLSIDNNPWKTVFAAGALLSGTLTTAANNGTATFNNLRIDKPAPGYSLTANAASLTGTSSSAFNVNLVVSQISASTSGAHSCAITTTVGGGAVLGTYCWGYNGQGQLGVAPLTQQQDSIPVLTGGGQALVSVTTGAQHSCGLTAAGAAYCWGYNFYGQLGDGTSGNGADKSTPVAVTGNHVFAQIDAGWLHTCGVTTASATPAEDRQVYCWGYNQYGQVGDGTSGGANQVRNTPTRVAQGAGLQTDEATQVSAGQFHSCARAPDGDAYCWGYNYNGQLGNGTLLTNGGQGTDSPSPALVAGAISWLSIDAGTQHTCGISAVPGNPGYCWGYNGNGQIGNQTTGSNTSLSSPASVFGGFAWTSISAGGNHTCGVVSGGTGYCWGYNGNGNLGDDNAPTSASQPVQVTGSIVFDRISAGQDHSCGRSTTSQAFCWGYNGNGRLGSPGTNTNKKVPTQIIQ